MKKVYDVLCVGLIVSDLLIHPVDKGIFEVDTTRIEKIKLLPGGDAMNEALILAKLGQKTGILGKVGDDEFGHMVLQQANAIGVDTSCVKVDRNTITSASLVLVNQNGDRNFVYCSGNNESLTLADIDLALIKQAKIVCIGSLLGLPGLDKEGTAAIFREARENHVITVADATHDICNIGFAGIENVLKYTDIFMPSYTEGKYITGESDPRKMATILLSCGVKTVVIKLGKKGCFIQNAEEHYHLPAYKVAVVDTTGGGDNFVAGFLTGISNGWHLKECGMFANAVGAISTQKIGANTAVKSQRQVQEFMQKTIVHESVLNEY